MEYGLCDYKDLQTVVLQEMPEKVPAGLLSRSIECVLADDLVDKTKPGDRIQINGVFKPLVGGHTFSGGTFRQVVIATSVSQLQMAGDSELSIQDLRSCRELRNRPDLMTLLVNSMAPSIYGHPDVKKGCLMQLVGGMEKNLPSGTRLRGDINLLLIGDPSTAKSQMLRHMLNIAPLSFNTTGRGSSGVGLTAAVTFDKDTGEKQLEAGAMVLADRGLICIDEFDKMSPEDRTAMHEVMEQQTVTIAKAGIHVSLNARCSVLAAANPQYGEFMKDKPLNVNIGLPDSLLSRFDLIYIILDEKSSDHDRLIAERVTRNHRFLGPNIFANFFKQNDDDGVVEEQLSEAERVTEMFEKYNPLIHTHKGEQILTRTFLKKYLSYVKAIHPKLTDDTCNYITKLWTELRAKDFEYTKNKGNSRVLPVTVRTLESLIRLATANAKLRQSVYVDQMDCEAAVYLVRKTLFDEEEGTTPAVIQSSKFENGANSQLSRKMEIEKPAAKKSLSKRTLKEEDITNGPLRLEPVKENDENMDPQQLSAAESYPLRTQSVVTQTQQTQQSSLKNAESSGENDKEAQKKVFRMLVDIRKANKGASMVDYSTFMDKALPELGSEDAVHLILAQLDSNGKISWDSDSKVIMMM